MNTIYLASILITSQLFVTHVAPNTLIRFTQQISLNVPVRMVLPFTCVKIAATSKTAMFTS